ncbi:MAG: hypothetical protein ACRCZI_08675 [Cetobacterium sp.]
MEPDDFGLQEADADCELDGGDVIVLNGDIPQLSNEGKAILENLMMSIGGDPLKKGTEAYATKIINVLMSAANLTGNEVHAIAGCVDTHTIKNCKILDHDLCAPLPPYHMRGNSLENIMVNRVETCYNDYCRAQIEAMGSTNVVLSQPAFERIRPDLATGIRFFLHHWHLNPHLSRKENYNQGKELLLMRISAKMKPPQIIKALVHEMMSGIVYKAMHDALAFGLELQGKNSTFDAGATNQLQKFIPYYLQAQGYKWSEKKHRLDKLTALQEYLNTLDDDHDQKIKFGNFLGMVPRESDEYKAAKAVAAAAAKKAEENKAKKEAADKRKKKRTEERLAKQKAIIASESTDEDTDPTKAAEILAAGKRNLTEDEHKVLVKEFVKDLPRYNICNHSLPKEEVPKEVSGLTPEEIAFRKPTKYIIAICKAKMTVDVMYYCAGELFVQGVKKRFYNIVTILNALDQFYPKVIAGLFHKAEEAIKVHDFPIHGLLSIVALFMDTSGDVVFGRPDVGIDELVSTTVERIKYAPCLETPANLSKDMIALLPTLFNKGNNTILTLTVFGLLATTRGKFGGMSAPEIWDKLDSEVLCKAELVPRNVANQFIFLAAIILKLSQQGDDDWDGSAEVYQPFLEIVECDIADNVMSKATTGKRRRASV